MAYKVFTNGSTLQASELNENLMRQSVAVFSNSAARTAAITSPVEGQMTYLEDSNRYEFYTGSAWTSPFGLTQIVNQTIGSGVASVVITNCFSSAYDTYKIVVSGGANSAANNYLRILLGSSTANYNWGLFRSAWSTAGVTALAGEQQGAWQYAGSADTNGLALDVTLTNPFLTARTWGTGSYADPTSGGPSQMYHTATTSHTGFTLATSAGTMTGGNIAVYGYRKVA